VIGQCDMFTSRTCLTYSHQQPVTCL